WHAEPEKPTTSRALSWGIDGIVELYRITLEWVLRHQPATLLVTCMTLAMTIWLYVIAPKGFLPDQDTGLVTAVLEAEPQVSFAEVSGGAETGGGGVKKGPGVAGGVAVAGVGTLNTTPNLASLKITLKPRDERTELVGAIVKRLTKVANSVPGVTVFFQ